MSLSIVIHELPLLSAVVWLLTENMLMSTFTLDKTLAAALQRL